MLFFLLFFAAWSYLIVALQVASGIPPFYVHLDKSDWMPGYEENMLSLLIPKGLWLFVSVGFLLLAAELEIPVLAAVGAIAPAYLGISTRKFLKQERGLPYPLLDLVRFRLPIAGRVFDQWPMLVFDVWTVGMSLVLPAVMLLQAYTQ